MIVVFTAVCTFAVAAHLFNPSDWSALGIKVLHSMHGPGFSILALIVFWFLQSQNPALTNYYLAGAITMGVGLISEAAQVPGPRDAQIQDLLADGLGISGALGIAFAFDRQARSTIRRGIMLTLPVLAGAALSVSCGPAVWYSYALVQQQRLFPSLLVFEDLWEHSTLSQEHGLTMAIAKNPDNWTGSGDSVAYAREHGRWGIFVSVHPIRDWRRYSGLSFIAASGSATAFTMALCIRDERPNGNSQFSRFCKDIVVGPMVAEYSIEFSEIENSVQPAAFDFAHVDAVVFSASKPGGGNSIYLDDVRLDP